MSKSPEVGGSVEVVGCQPEFVTPGLDVQGKPARAVRGCLDEVGVDVDVVMSQGGRDRVVGLVGLEVGHFKGLDAVGHAVEPAVVVHARHDQPGAGAAGRHGVVGRTEVLGQGRPRRACRPRAP